MKRCKLCLLVTNGVEPTLDSDSVCSYCRVIETYSETLSKIGQGEQLLRDRLERFKSKGKYDCLVGFSGGKDSSYVIYRLRSHYGARVLAFTWDNGFLTDYAKENINRVVAEFGIDHLWSRPHDSVLQAVYKQSLDADGWPCSACFSFAEASPWKLAYENRIPFIVNGRIPEQILRTPSRSSFESADSLLVSNLRPYDPAEVRRRAVSILKRMEKVKEWLLPDKSLWPLASESIYLPMDYELPDDFAPELLSFFLFERHDESRIMDILEQNTSWVRPEAKTPLSHADCEAHDAAGYMYHKTYGRTFLNLEISALIRHNKLSREEGERILQQASQEAKVYPADSMKILSDVSSVGTFALRAAPLKAKISSSWKPKLKRILGRG